MMNLKKNQEMTRTKKIYDSHGNLINHLTEGKKHEEYQHECR